LRRLARRTWAFFERFVAEEDHWLPPDNFQEEPQPRLAHRTSPTNVGLYLLSSLAAHDFGYLGASALLERLQKTFDTLGSLERFRGHLFNWYETQTLHALNPHYISTVDSGNLLGCLIALRHALEEKLREAVVGRTALAGLEDGLDVLEESARSGRAGRDPASLLRAVGAVRAAAGNGSTSLPGWWAWLASLQAPAGALPGAVGADAGEEVAFVAARVADLVRQR